jgi:hypothetical protein
MHLSVAFLVLAMAASEERSVIDTVVAFHTEEARAFWAEVHRDPNADTMRGKASTLHPARLAIAATTIRPLTKADFVYDSAPSPQEKQFDRMRRARTPLFRAYAALRGGEPLPWLAQRRDLLVVPARWSWPKNPEPFYAKYPDARGLLNVSAPAIAGEEALIYTRLLMVYRIEGRVFYLRREHGRWRIVWHLTLLEVPGC